MSCNWYLCHPVYLWEYYFNKNDHATFIGTGDYQEREINGVK